MKNNIQLSVIIPVFNAGEFITDLIMNLKHIKNSEIIAVNDGSTDDSLLKLLELNQVIENIVVIDQPNAGVSAARNRGINEANGEYIFFVDADDYVDVKPLNTILTKLKGEDIVFFGLVDQFISNGEITKTGETYIADKEIMINEFMLKFGFYLNKQIIYTPCNKLYKRELLVYNQILFDESYPLGEDVLFNLDVLKNVKTIKFSSYVIYYYNHFIERKNTGSTKFISNELDIAVEVFRQIYDLLKLYNVTEENIILVHKFIVRRISALINGVHCSTSPLTEFEKYSFLNKIYSCDILSNAISDNKVTMDSNRDKLFLFLHKHRMKLIIYIMYKIKSITR